MTHAFSPESARPPAPSPWTLMIPGICGIALAALLMQFRDSITDANTIVRDIADIARFVLLLAGIAGAGLAIVRQPRSPFLIGLSAIAALLCSYAVEPGWDAIRLPFRVLAVVAAMGAVLVALPTRFQRAALSVAIVFHFGGILTAITTVPPPTGGGAPWLPSQLWARVYRPYLQFMYLSNAYHFYSPDPGPATVIWARIEYSDDSYRWVIVPNREEHMKDPFALTYYRRLCMAESTNQLVPVNAITPVMAQQRAEAGRRLGIPEPLDIERIIPTAPQHRAPTDYSAMMISSYARFLFRAYPHENPAVAVRAVKVYRVVHLMVSPEQLAHGTEPTDHSLYLPYFQGEFNRDGKLTNPNDPFLYWLLPILRFPKAAPTASEQFEFINYAEIHGNRKQIRSSE